SNMELARTWAAVPPNPNQPAYLKLDHEDEVIYNAGRSVKAGTFVALVEQLTRHDRLDILYNETFLLTYPTFTCAAELVEHLLQRLDLPIPPDLNDDEYEDWLQEKQDPIRIRTVNILKAWIERYWVEPPTEATMDLLRYIESTVRAAAGPEGLPTCASLLTIIEHRLSGRDILRRLVSPIDPTIPKSILPRNMKKLKFQFLDLDATEIARQLTIIESQFYARIKSSECLNKDWHKKEIHVPNRIHNHPNYSGVNAMIAHSNQIANWVAESILSQDETKKRVALIKHFVSIADNCNTLNNFATLLSIISGLGVSPVFRLQRTWAQVHIRIRTQLETMRTMMCTERNFTRYRERLRIAQPPCVPFLGIHLTDLTFITDGNPDHTPASSSMINFQKRALLARILHEMRGYQSMPYNLRPVGEIQDFLIAEIHKAGEMGEMGMYERSLVVEPREGGEDNGDAGGQKGQGVFAATGSHLGSVVIASMAMRGRN
ncbi:ras GEF, partial [Aspergillus heteromorphus CBS 117.55]